MKEWEEEIQKVREEQKGLISDAIWPLAASARVYLFFVPDPFRDTTSFVSFREYAPFD
jgi:hypothetical protein